MVLTEGIFLSVPLSQRGIEGDFIAVGINPPPTPLYKRGEIRSLLNSTDVRGDVINLRNFISIS
jgi:hypothetical protein